jgi:hypothetical protein
VAAQLTAVTRLRSLLASERFPVHVPARAMVTVVALCAMIAAASLIVGIREAHRRATHAEARYDAARAVLAVPPMPLDPLRAELATVQADLAAARAQATAVVSGDATADPTVVLVQRAQAAGLTVRGLASEPASQRKAGDAAYNVTGLRIDVDGTLAQVTAFLRDVARRDPSLVPALTSATTGERGLLHTQLVFNRYAPVTQPAPAAVATPRAAR